MAALPRIPEQSEPTRARGWFLRLARQREWFHAALIDPGRGDKETCGKETDTPKPGERGNR